MNTRYTFANEQFLKGDLSWTTDTFKVILIDTVQYTVLKDTHKYLSDVPAAARVATTGALTGKTATNGVAKADSITAGPVFGQTVRALVIYHDTGTEGTSELVAYLDTASGLPINPQGTSVQISWDTTASGIFVL
jgi:hypothetical protein